MQTDGSQGSSWGCDLLGLKRLLEVGMQTSSPEPGWGPWMHCHRVSTPGWDVISQLWRAALQVGGDLLWQYHKGRPFKDLPPLPTREGGQQ